MKNEDQVVIRKMTAQDIDQAMALLARWNMAPVSAGPDNPNPERTHIEIGNAFVAEDSGRVVGVCSYFVLSETDAETASLAVDPAYLKHGIGNRLQTARLQEMKGRGIRRVLTEADRPETIRWYIGKFGYRKTGTNPKKHPFGLLSVDHWTVLELDLERWAEQPW